MSSRRAMPSRCGCAETKPFCKEKRQRHTQEEVGECGCHEIEHGMPPRSTPSHMTLIVTMK